MLGLGWKMISNLTKISQFVYEDYIMLFKFYLRRRFSFKLK